jgi:thioredoxin 1
LQLPAGAPPEESMMYERPDHPQNGSPGRASSDPIQTVTVRTFKALVLDAERPVAVEFMSYGCAHCRAIEPVLQKVAEMVKARETIYRVNIAVEQELADAYEVRGTPTFIMFRNGAEAGRVSGPRPTLSIVMAALTEPFEP